MEIVNVERTFGMIKPTGVRRGLVGEIVSRIERKGLRLEHLEMRMITEEQVRAHYHEYKDTEKIEFMAKYFVSGPVVLMVIGGSHAVRNYREMAGRVSVPGTIRGDLATEQRYNIIHSASSIEEASRELEIYFPGQF